MKIVLATDGSIVAQTALVAAVRLLKRRHNQFDLLCVLPEFDKPRSMAASEVCTRNAAAGRIMYESRKILRGEGIQAEPIALAGSPADVC